MVEKTPAEQQPNDSWVLEAYQRVQMGEFEDLPIGLRLRQALDDYDAIFQEGGEPHDPAPLRLKFRHFSQTLLGTSPGIEAFTERTEFLYSTEFRKYYADTAKLPANERVIQRTTEAVSIGLGGLLIFSERHPEHRSVAVGCMAEHFLPTPDKKFVGGKTALSRIVGTKQELFRGQLDGGYFQDVTPSPEQQLAIECLQHLNFGEVKRAIGATAIHNAIYAPLKAETMYHLRNFNTWLTDVVEKRRLGEPLRIAGYESMGTAKLYSDSYGMLRRAANYVAELGSANAAAILKGLPEPLRGQPTSRDRVFALANALTDQMNTAYFHDELRLQRLDTRSNGAQIQAFDRILYILHKELPPHDDPKVDARQHETLSLVGQIASGLIELVEAEMEARNPITVGDIVTMYPDADPETIQTIIAGAKQRFESSRGQSNAVYTEYRRSVRRQNQLLFMRKAPGKGFIS